MGKSTAEIFSEKVSLIYEYDKSSPLFIRMANIEVENNDLERAIDILSGGIKKYPYHAAARLILGRVLTLLGNYSQALKEIKTGCDLLHSKKTYEYYLKEIENIKRQRSLFESSSRSAFLWDEPKAPGIVEEENIEESPEEVRENIPNEQASLEDRLDQLAKEISAARLPDSNETEIENENPLEDFAGENMIVSDTLAKIYIAQGEYNEAIQVYKKLKKKHPEKQDYYDKKIKELNSELDSE